MSFYSEFAGHYESIFPLEEETYRFLLERAPASARVLDIGCGTGDYCGRFAGDGREATGLDLDPEMVAAAAERFPGASFLVMDMADVGSLRGTFDCAYCIGNVLSHLGGERLPRFLADVRALLSPGGSWVFQTVNWDFLLRLERFRFPDVEVPGSGLVFEREYPRISESATPFVTRLRRGTETVFEGSVSLYPLRSEDYRTAHEAAGFRFRGHYGSFRSDDFDVRLMSPSVFDLARG